jgi:hypothetical protein
MVVYEMGNSQCEIERQIYCFLSIYMCGCETTAALCGSIICGDIPGANSVQHQSCGNLQAATT